MTVESLKATYAGKLSSTQIANGINAAFANVNRLAEDAILLLEAGRYPTAASLAILAIEEYGKAGILREIARTDEADKLKALWKDYRNHTKKNIIWTIPGLLARGENFCDVAAQVFDKSSDYPKLIDHIKQLGFYTDCLDNMNWSYPTNRVDKRMAESIVEIARFYSNAKKTTSKEIEIWVKHFKGVPYENADMVCKAFSEYHLEIQDCGLSSKKLDDFLNFAKKQMIPQGEPTSK
jgi:AbiV family abortive infection protein